MSNTNNQTEENAKVKSDTEKTATNVAKDQTRFPKKDNGNNKKDVFRKRRYTVGADVYKSFQKKRRKEEFLPLTVFRLGGNIHDPLNLQSIKAGCLPNGAIATSPLQSVSQTGKQKVEVFIPPNIRDPLNLSCPDGLNVTDLISPTKTNLGKQHEHFNFKRLKRRRTSSETEIMEIKGEAKKLERKAKDDTFLTHKEAENLVDSLTKNRLNDKKFLPSSVLSLQSPPSVTNKDDTLKNVSKVSELSNSSTANLTSQEQRNLSETKAEIKSDNSKFAKNETTDCYKTRPNETVKKQEKKKLEASKPMEAATSIGKQISNSVSIKKETQFQYGNYNRYYGYRNMKECDPRIALFRRNFFEDKEILDIGCNIGHVTLTIARDFKPKRIVGIDIDQSLIAAAMKNIRHYVTEKVVETGSFPMSMPLLFGPITGTPVDESNPNAFPNNVLFFALNYVPDNDECLRNQKPDYDCILCLSLTKWIHLNWGDVGLKRMFRRIFMQLRPGGCMLLEPQPWSTYYKRSKMTPTTLENFRSIRFKPEQFNDFLLKDVGFKSCELLGTPDHKAKGFQRPIYMYKKI